MARFDKLLGWMAEQSLDQQRLRLALNAIRSPQLRPHSKSEIGRLVNGKVRFVEPFLASELESLTGGAVTAADYLAHVATSTKTRLGLEAA